MGLIINLELFPQCRKLRKLKHRYMNVRELKEKLNNLPDTMEILIPREDGESVYTLLQSAEVKSIRMHECEEPDGLCECEAVAYDDCLVLEEI